MKKALVLLCSVFAACLAQAQATLEAPAQAVPGSSIDVAWSGPGERYDAIQVVRSGAADDAGAITAGKITNADKNPLPVLMPDEPGAFELRYVSFKSKQILARRPVELVDVATSLEAPEQAPIGSILEIHWTSSGNSYDVVALVPAGAAADAKALKTATVLGRNPLTMTLPEQPGEFELRYVTRLNKRVLTSRPLSIVGVDASLSAPDNATLGATIEITWEGPGNQYDKVALYVEDAADDAKPLAVAAINSRRNPVTMKLPEQPGQFELRYLTARENNVLARRPLSVGEVSTALSAPDVALANTSLAVGWTGPGNDYDRIELIDPQADPVEVLAKGTVLGRRSPVRVNLPDLDGDFELRYVTARSGAVLASRALRLQPAGRLAVVYERESEIGSGAQGGSGAVELILDASGSMLKRTASGQRRIEIAREVLDDIVRNYLADGQMFALRVFGHREADSCRTDLEIALGPLQRDGAAGLIAGVNAMNLAKTPIAASLALVPNDLLRADGPKTVVLITDGEETCDGDPEAVIESLRAGGLDIQLSIVGFAIDDAQLRTSFEQWARLGGGSYFDAQSADELLSSLRTVISGPFRVFDASGAMVGEGIIGGADIVLPAGTYRVETAGQSPRVIDEVVVTARELTTAAF